MNIEKTDCREILLRAARRGVDWRKKACPNPRKGEVCYLCGAAYVCRDLDRPKVYEIEARSCEMKKDSP